MPLKILLLNPPIHDFSAYDFWLKPYGLLRVAGFLREQAEFRLFDFMDRYGPALDKRATDAPTAVSSAHPCRTGEPAKPAVPGSKLAGTSVAPSRKLKEDPWGRGEFHRAPLEKPAIFAAIPRRYHRFGVPRDAFRNFLAREGPFDVALIQTVMTYWYPGVQEVLADLREFSPQTKTVLGGVYAEVCPAHARGLGADLVVDSLNLDVLWRFLGLKPDEAGMPLWDLYETQKVGVLKLADGCPFKCTYCSVPQRYPTFHARPLVRSLAEFDFLLRRGVENIAFYDDALLYQPDRILVPFLREVLKRNSRVNFHTPNALNARFIDREMAELMVSAGFKLIYLGFESSAYEWQKKTGGKVYSDELARAVENLVDAGAAIEHIHAYLIAAHPQSDQQNVAASMEYAHSLGIRVMLSEFSPIPGTPDGELCRRWVDLDEPLYHNKTAFPIFSLGEAEINRLKTLARDLNQKLKPLLFLAR